MRAQSANKRKECGGAASASTIGEGPSARSAEAVSASTLDTEQSKTCIADKDESMPLGLEEL